MGLVQMELEMSAQKQKDQEQPPKPKPLAVQGNKAAIAFSTKIPEKRTHVANTLIDKKP